MINRMIPIFIALLLTTGSANALDMDKPVLCASIDVYECVDGGGCSEVLPEEVDAPTFFRLDLKKQTIRVTRAAAPEKAANFAELDGRLVMQGVDRRSPAGRTCRPTARRRRIQRRAANPSARRS